MQEKCMFSAKIKNLTKDNDKNCKNIFKKKLKPITLYT